jgi:hypothetical protein
MVILRVLLRRLLGCRLGIELGDMGRYNLSLPFLSGTLLRAKQGVWDEFMSSNLDLRSATRRELLQRHHIHRIRA